MKYLPEQSSASMIQFRLLIFEPYPADIVQLLQALHSPQTPAELLLFSENEYFNHFYDAKKLHFTLLTCK